ncbi:alkaline phosphatase PhoX [Paraferrimonas sp. SM1919]|uniref:alkaline phosphatase PhoX n=1 Tax=Paraferrimonas sp. SM1919 TaxID=2662263 RepID=UPI0013D63091|nr:alkaline phosphatase PhoX [Paraferrimonas sp. SM1919]
MITRRQFTLGLTALAFTGLTGCSFAGSSVRINKLSRGYGDLVVDPNGLLDLPSGFSYKVISQFGQLMSDGLHVPDNADGMGCIQLDADRVALIRNHELSPKHLKKQPSSIQKLTDDKAYDTNAEGKALPGGTTTLVYNIKTGQLEKEYLSLIGTIRNCAGGVTPWGTWLTCEETNTRAGEGLSKDHGYIFEVPANSDGLVAAKPLTAMGRFQHEAAAVDPRTGIVYLTEDWSDSLFYRFIPNEYGKLHKGGRLQALVVLNQPQFDTRNWDSEAMPLSQWFATTWIDIENPESPEDDLRKQGYSKGAALFARGEGIHWGDNELYFCCTNGGGIKHGQIMRYQPSEYEGSSEEEQSPGRIQLFVESLDKADFNFGDNITVTPQGHLLVCEDQYTDSVNNYLRGVAPDGSLYPFARLTAQTEPAGACFSPDGSTLFVNVYKGSKTLAITGPWGSVTKG